MRKLLAAIVLLTVTPSAVALDAATLESKFEASLQRASARLAPGLLEWDPIEVVQEGSALRLRVPHLALTDQSGKRMELGPFDLRVREQVTGFYAFDDVHMPQRLFLKEADRTVASFKFEIERFSGTLAPSFDTISQLDMVIREMEVQQPELGTVMLADRVEAFVETLPEVNAYGATGNHDQRLHYVVSGLTSIEPGFTLYVRDLALEAELLGLDWTGFEELRTLMGDAQIAAAGGDHQRLAELRQAAMDLSSIAERSSLSVRVEGLYSLNFADNSSIALEQVSLALGGEVSRDGEETTGDLSLAGGGLSFGGPLGSRMGPYLALVPQRWSLPIHLEQVPARELMGQTIDVLTLASTKPQDIPVLVSKVMRDFMQMLGEAEARMLVRDLFVEWPFLRLDGKASFVYSTTSPRGAVGTGVAILSGLERMQTEVEGLANQEAKHQALAVLLALRGFGQAVPQADGSVVQRYTIVYSPEGTITINGYSLSKLLDAVPQ